MITFDIKDLYVNIPIDETIKYLKTKLLGNNTPDNSSAQSSISKLFHFSTKILSV
jgi:hypothetical protein